MHHNSNFCLNQAQALVAVLAHFNWTYIALVGQEGTYSANLNEYIRQAINTDNLGICIGYQGQVHTEESDGRFDEIVQDLVKQRKARVIVVTINPESIKQLGRVGVLKHIKGSFEVSSFI